MTTDFNQNIVDIYLIFIMWSSWFPLLMYISFGYNKKLANKMTTISIELFPLSTKSPLKIYGLSTEGRPFWNKFYIELFLPVYKITIEDIWIINRKKRPLYFKILSRHVDQICRDLMQVLWRFICYKGKICTKFDYEFICICNIRCVYKLLNTVFRVA